MPTDYSNFTTPDNAIDPNPTSQGQGQASPARWDPIAKRWVGSTSGPVGTPQARPPGTTWDMESKQWVPVGDARSDGSTTYEGNVPRDATTAGRVEARSTADGFETGGSWGGYVGTMVRGPDGNLVLDGSMSGRAADVDHLRGLGAAAVARDAYQNDYGQAEADAGLGAQARLGQDHAQNLAYQQALGNGSHAQALGQNMLRQGVQTQQAAAMSTRGGSLAQAAAMRRQQGGQAAYVQQGNTQLQALRADEMAAGRKQFLDTATAARAQDAQAQGLHQSQATSQMQNELAQRELGQTGQMAYEGMAQNVNKSAQDAALKNREIHVGIDAAAGLRNAKLADREMQRVGTAASAGGSMLAGLSQMGTSNSGGDPNDPRKKRDGENAMSDERAKTAVRPMSLGEAAARRAR